MLSLLVRRTLIERADAIFQLIEKEDDPFPKSKLQDIGFNPSTAEKWLDLITFIQRKPRIRIIKTGSSTIIERTETGYQVMSREIFMDTKRSYKDRFHALQSYLSALITSERINE